MTIVTFRSLQISDAPALSELLKSSPPEYIQYFHPFPFEAAVLEDLISEAKKDCFVAVEANHGRNDELAGFYMLRGLDEGYPAPMYGVFIAHKYRNNGLGLLTLIHAEASCRLSQIDRLMLKVNPKNEFAKKLYQAHGFTTLREDPKNQNLLMEKSLVRDGD